MNKAIKEILDQYQQDAARTLNNEIDNPLDEYVLGIMGETGEVIEVIKKRLFHDHDLTKLVEEIGDSCWYLSAICTTTGCGTLGACMRSSWCGDEGDSLLGLAMAAWSGTNAVRLCIHCSLSQSEAWKETLRTAIGFLLRVYLKMCNFIDVDLSDVLSANIEKLIARYPETFTSEASKQRSAYHQTEDNSL